MSKNCKFPDFCNKYGDCIRGGDTLFCRGWPDDDSFETYVHNNYKRIQINRSYDGSKCFCKPCVGCYQIWIPASVNKYGLQKCDSCITFDNSHFERFKGSYRWKFDSRLVPDSTVTINAFIARLARARWRWAVRKILLCRSYMLYWMEAVAKRRYDPRRIDMVDDLASALRRC